MRSLFSMRGGIAVLLAVRLASRVKAQEWPYNLPPHQKYWPEHEALVRLGEEAQQRFGSQMPIGVRKMSDDPNEMFFPGYWIFDKTTEIQDAKEETFTTSETIEPVEARPRWHMDLRAEEHLALFGNSSLDIPALPPFLPHASDSADGFSMRNFPRNLLAKRQFQCPSGTNSCTSINQPNSCCPSDETCMLITDTGLGNVGCCPIGANCAGLITSCNVANGYTSCPNSPNGGCCIPNYSCQGIGCVAADTTVVVVPVVTITVSNGNTIVVTSILTPAVATPIVVTSTIVAIQTLVPVYTPSTQTVFTTLAPPVSVLTVIPGVSTNAAGSTVCLIGYNTCDALLGGGCCPTNRACASGGFCAPLSTALTTVLSTITEPNPAIRPTSASGDAASYEIVYTTSTTTIVGIIGAGSTLTAEAGSCPTGYFMCSGYVVGCCQNGRACDTMSCPATATNEVVISGAQTIEVPVSSVSKAGGVGGAAASRTTVTIRSAASTAVVTTTVSNTALVGGAGAHCAVSWYSCGADVGGGCCPSGYSCGATCSAASAAGPGSVNKVAPASQAVNLEGWAKWMTSLMGGVALLMLWL